MSDNTQDESPVPPRDLQSRLLAALAGSSSATSTPSTSTVAGSSTSRKDRSKGLIKFNDIMEGKNKNDKDEVAQVISVEDENEEGRRRSRYGLHCPRDGCGSVVLREGVATFRHVEPGLVPQIDAEPDALPACLPTLDTSAPTHWWFLKGSPMLFENITFSKAVPVATASTSSSDTSSNAITNPVAGLPRKLLACGECDIGPIGWAQGNEYWLVADRVSYKVQE